MDSAQHHELVIRPSATGPSITLVCAPGHERSDLRWALLRHIQIHLRDQVLRLDAASGSVQLPQSTLPVSIYVGKIKIAQRNPNGPDPIDQPLTPYESRYLADNRRAPAPRRDVQIKRLPRTDLHTHLAGCLRAEDLVRLGADHGVQYTAQQLAGALIHSQRGQAIADLEPRIQEALINALRIPIDRQVTFSEMEKIYKLRAPVTKTPGLFADLLQQIARDYSKMGVDYAELSLHQITDSELLKQAHRSLPKIQEETGVDLRFLAAFGRADDPEWVLDYLDRVKQLAGSRYIVGVDIMGHEINSTKVIAPHLQALAAWAHEHRPGFVIRVHAGENAAFPGNIRVAAQSVQGKDVQLRIGHGLYGADDETMGLLQTTQAIVEFNLSSNFALNNLQCIDEHSVPLKRYIDAGIPVVLGTDGYGIYQTDIEAETHTAIACGLNAEAIEWICRSEDNYLCNRATRDIDRNDPRVYVVPDALPQSRRRYSSAIEDKNRELRQRRDQRLEERLREIEVTQLSRQACDQRLRSKRMCVAFSGAWKHSWARVAPAQQDQVRATVRGLLSAWSPDDVAIITGGTQHGLEHVVQTEAMKRGFVVIGAIVRDLAPEDLCKGELTHTVFVGESLYDKASGLYRLLKNHNGWCLFVGGGPIVNDEIQIARNLYVRHLLMNGPNGASTDHATEQPERAFVDAESGLAKMTPNAQIRSAYYYQGPNPCADVVLVRTRNTQPEILLIRRADDDRPSAGQWALPGGFQRSNALPGEVWSRGAESSRQAAIRELEEETSINLTGREPDLIYVGDYEGNGRDPRDSEVSWSLSSAYTMAIEGELAAATLVGGNDACQAQWFGHQELPVLAFDHIRIIDDALRILVP